ncbi:hypothetical protein DPMN_143985 [Dreissena polymorpha]|uniref:Uncharacterized protein n=1 Tax=Dreissena polymorpha TaxID=45954 RepID=A0A9D4GK68_DREPO|nr:hypothetical protein DPMN_143985 [Dreissena polymorpha]
MPCRYIPETPGVDTAWKRRPDSRGAPGSFKCPVYSTDTLHPRLTSLAEDLLVLNVLKFNIVEKGLHDWLVVGEREREREREIEREREKEREREARRDIWLAI